MSKSMAVEDVERSAGWDRDREREGIAPRRRVGERGCFLVMEEEVVVEGEMMVEEGEERTPPEAAEADEAEMMVFSDREDGL